MPIEPSRWMIVLAMISMLSLGMAGTLWMYQLQQPRIVTVDLVGIVDDARSRLRGGKQMAAFAQKLQRELARMSREEHLLILPGRAVAAGAPDITAKLRARLLP